LPVLRGARSREKNGAFKKIEEFLNVVVFSMSIGEFEFRRSPVGLPKSLDVEVALAESPESLLTRIEQQRSHGDGAPDRRFSRVTSQMSRAQRRENRKGSGRVGSMSVSPDKSPRRHHCFKMSMTAIPVALLAFV
jgi:hypothetical protein